MLNPIKEVLTKLDKDRIILEQARRNREVVYGSRSIQAQVPGSRMPSDWDLLSKSPRKSAGQLTGTLNRKSGNGYYTKRALHKGTYRVMNKGQDNIRGSRDDYNIADYSRVKGRVKTIKHNGVLFLDINETMKHKQTSLKDKRFAFRHRKDLTDLKIIKHHKKMKGNRLLRKFL